MVAQIEVFKSEYRSDVTSGDPQDKRIRLTLEPEECGEHHKIETDGGNKDGRIGSHLVAYVSQHASVHDHVHHKA